MNNQNNDAAISDADLDAVAGGFFATEHAKISSAGGSGGGPQGGSDEAERLTRIYQQLTTGR